MKDSYKYNVEIADDGFERIVSCVNLYKHKLYRGVVQTLGKGRYACLFEILEYPLQYIKYGGLNNFSSRYVIERLDFEIPSCTTQFLNELREKIPLELLHQAFKIAISELYLYNKRVTSDKYKYLVANYSELEGSYLRNLEGCLNSKIER